MTVRQHLQTKSDWNSVDFSFTTPAEQISIFWPRKKRCGNGRTLLGWPLVVSVCVPQLSNQYFSFFFFKIISSLQSAFRRLPFCYSSLSPHQSQPRSQTSSPSPFSRHIFVSDEGRDLLSCLTVLAGLGVRSPSPFLLILLPPSLPVSLFGRVTPPHQCSDYKNPVCSFWESASLSGHSRWWGELIATLLRSHCLPSSFPVLLSCLSSFFFSPHFLTLPLSWLFSLLATHSLCPHITLLSMFPQWPPYFLTIIVLVLFWLIFMNSAVMSLTSHSTHDTLLPKKRVWFHPIRKQLQKLSPFDCSTVWNVVDLRAPPYDFPLTCFYLHVLACLSQEYELCLVWWHCSKRDQVSVRLQKRIRYQVVLHAALCSRFTFYLYRYSICSVYHLARQVNAFVFQRHFVHELVCSASSFLSSLLHCLGSSSRTKLSQNPPLHLLSSISPGVLCVWLYSHCCHCYGNRDSRDLHLCSVGLSLAAFKPENIYETNWQTRTSFFSPGVLHTKPAESHCIGSARSCLDELSWCKMAIKLSTAFN